MTAAFSRIILYVQQVDSLSAFYQQHFSFVPVETIPDEWALLNCNGLELALHRAGPAYRNDSVTEHSASNAKIVFSITEDIHQVRQHMIQQGANLGAVKDYPGFDYLLCDGKDPEGNIFQLMQHIQPASI